ncbi:serine hydrolase domain-containing protein [Sphingomonas sp. KR1UV-12]|uniref:Serine hydrolase domain-containing protein n=1 Tax=Sphingomonas aurea TaxID=3063994 RepID=A0ABT9EK18_9SPHN|nr:serine hydrolase domain-containing protein [Sphingomonas sp. KR1UV-12]MDP1027296.1 serine hydrolase domain-containing protein [Sphingomonas sp. KR1UV-12]
MKTLAAAPLILSLLAAPLVAQAPQPQPRPAAQAPTAVAYLPHTQALFDGYVRDGKMPGIVGAFGVGDAPTLFPAAGRISDDRGAAAAGPDSLWRVYSMTKPITGMAAMIMIEDGRLKLDQPISDFFPGFAKMRVLTSPDTSLDSVPAKTAITVRHLLTHTAGLGYTIVTKGPLLKEYERLGLVPATVNAEVEAKARATRPATLAAFAERVATMPLIAEPGTKWSYSIGLDVLAAVIEKASGMPFERFVQTRLFDPLKMRSSYWTVPASAAGRLATNYAFTLGSRAPLDPGATSVWLQPPSFPYGGAGLVMSARDYDRFLHMLLDEGTLDGVRVMKPETVRLGMSNLLPDGVTFGEVGGGTGGTQAAAPMGFGAGGSVYLADGPGGFPGKGTYGWGGAAGTIAWVDPVKKVRGTVMVNYFPADQYPLRRDVTAALMQDAMRLHGTTSPR